MTFRVGDRVEIWPDWRLYGHAKCLEGCTGVLKAPLTRSYLFKVRLDKPNRQWGTYVVIISPHNGTLGWLRHVDESPFMKDLREYISKELGT